MEDTLQEFAKLTGKTVEDGINDIARSVARKLAEQVQPYGLKSDKGEKFKKSIGHQVDRVWFGVNMGAFPATTDMKAAHYSARNGSRKGTVPHRLFRKEKGKPWLDLIPGTERDSYKRKAQAKAGRAKGAWVEAANAIGGPKLSGIADWIGRHASGGFGSASKTGKGLGYQVTLENRTPYLGRILPAATVAKSMANGLKNGFTRLQKIIDKEIEKANRTL